MRTNRFATGQPTPTDNLLPVQLAFTNLPKARPQKESFGLSRRSLLTRASAGMCATKRRYRRLLAQARACGALVSSIEVAQIWSFRVRGKNHICRRDLLILLFILFQNARFELHKRTSRSLPLETISPETASSNHAHTSSRRKPSPLLAMHVIDVGLIPVRPFVVLLQPVPPGCRNDRATALQRVRPQLPCGNCGSYSSDSPSPLRLKHLATDQAPPNQRRQQSTFPD